MIGENKWDVSLFLTQGVSDQIRSSGRRKMKIGFDDEGGGGKKKSVAEESQALCCPGEIAAGFARGGCIKTSLTSSPGSSRDINILPA